MTSISRALFVVLGLALLGPTLPTLEAPAFAWTQLAADEDAPVLNVDRGRSAVVEIERPFATLAVADPEIASVTATSNRSFFVRGKAPGWTTVLIYDEAGSVIDLIQVNVALGLDALRRDLNTLLPGEDVQVLPVMMVSSSAATFLQPVRQQPPFS